MEQEVTNNVEATTQVTTDVVNEANTVAETQTQTESNTQEVDGAQANAGDSYVENSNQEAQGNEQQVQQPTIEQLQARLKEYEVRDEEDRQLREKLGLKDVDQQTYNYMNLDQQIVNEGKQVYLQLCNEYGIDANPDKIDESIKKLEETDPRRAYEFQRKFESLGNEVYGKRQAVQQQTAYYEVSKFANDYNQLLNASPAINNVMTQYVETYGASNDMYRQLKSVMDVILPVYQEAFEYGKRYSLEDRAKRDTSGVQGGIATANTQTYTPPQGAFTREQIAKMSTEEFAKNEKAIMQQMIEGKL